MILDLQTIFSDDQALTASAVSTNVIDLGATGTPALGASALVRDVGIGEPIEILIQHVVAAGGTSPTISVVLEMDTAEGFPSGTTVATSNTIAAAVVGELQPAIMSNVF